MAKKANSDKWLTDEDIAIPANARKVTSELPPTRKIKENSRIAGIFQSFKMVMITDTNTHKPKDVACYTFRDPKDSTQKFAVLGGRVGLDSAFSDLADDSGGWDALKGMMVVIERGEDSERSGGGAGIIGNYSLASWMPEKE